MGAQLDIWQTNDRVLAGDERGEILYRPRVFSEQEARRFFEELLEKTPWAQESMWMYDKSVSVPRLLYRYGDLATLPPTLQAIRRRVESLEDTTFNRLSLNLYRDERDSVAWHSDHEEAMIERPAVVLVSLGAPRPMDIRERADHRKRLRVLLQPGSVLTMRGRAQRNYEHCIPKLRVPAGPRISIALRQYAPEGSAPQPCAQCAAAKRLNPPRQ